MFQILKKDVADSEVLEYLKVNSDEGVVFGAALKLGASGVDKCAPTDRPQFICRGEIREDGTVPCGVVTTSTVYEVPYQNEAPIVGTLVTLHTDALQVTNTTSGGTFLVLSVDTATKTATGRINGQTGV